MSLILYIYIIHSNTSMASHPQWRVLVAGNAQLRSQLLVHAGNQVVPRKCWHQTTNFDEILMMVHYLLLEPALVFNELILLMFNGIFIYVYNGL